MRSTWWESPNLKDYVEIDELAKEIVESTVREIGEELGRMLCHENQREPSEVQQAEMSLGGLAIVRCVHQHDGRSGKDASCQVKGYYSGPHSYGGWMNKWTLGSANWVCTTLLGNLAIKARRDIRGWVRLPATPMMVGAAYMLLVPSSVISRLDIVWVFRSITNWPLNLWKSHFFNPIKFPVELLPFAFGPDFLFQLCPISLVRGTLLSLSH